MVLAQRDRAAVVEPNRGMTEAVCIGSSAANRCSGRLPSP
jgi:hypothetical protein